MSLIQVDKKLLDTEVWLVRFRNGYQVAQLGDHVMFKKALFMAALVAGLLVPSLGWSSTDSDSADIDITATVDPYFAWNIASTTIAKTDWTGSGGLGDHINRTIKTLNVALPIAATTNATAVISLQPAVGGSDNAGVLTLGATTDVLKTSYTIDNTTAKTYMANGNTNLGAYIVADGTTTGGIFAAGVADWNLNAPYSDGDTTFDLKIKAEMPGTVVNPTAGDYTCKVLLRATW